MVLMGKKYNKSPAMINKNITEMKEKLSEMQEQLSRAREARYAPIGRTFYQVFSNCIDFDIDNMTDAEIRAFIRQAYDDYVEAEYVRECSRRYKWEASLGIAPWSADGGDDIMNEIL